MTTAPGALSFSPIDLSSADRVVVPPGYPASTLIAWGDPLAPVIPDLNPAQPTPSRQEWQFGYNADSIWFLPLPVGSLNGNAGLLIVNHEYTNPELMFPGYDPSAPT